MKTHVALLILVTALFYPHFSDARDLWKSADPSHLAKTRRSATTRNYLVYSANETALRQQLGILSARYEEAQLIELPLPDGSFRQFRVWKNSMLPAKLAVRHPGLMTFTGEAVDNPLVTAKLDLTTYGFHAMIFDNGNTSFIDPYDKNHDGNYFVHYKRDETRTPENAAHCVVPASAASLTPGERQKNRQARNGHRTINGYELRTYRLALCCDHFYALAATNVSAPTLEQTLSEMTTTMNRVNGVYEREFSVTMSFVENEDTLIWISATGSPNGPDPFAAIDANAGACIDSNQIICDRRIGNANYDIGHVFTTGAGGFSQTAVVCQFQSKAESVTGQPDPVGDGFDIDYVAHEMGHEFGADHTFNGSAGNCGGGNIVTNTAYEPGSGSTIMAYAGICSPDDLQPHSDPYFHAASLEEIQDFITTLGDVCPVKTPTNNKLVSTPSFAASYKIPFLTPFEIIGPAATDSVADTSVTYCWEQWNLGDFGESLSDTHQYGPIFRSYIPVKSATRIFPKNSMVLSGVLSNAGIEDAEGEKVPDVARFLTFQLTLRDIYQGNGCFLISEDDTVHLDVINTGEGFKVTSQNTTGLYFIGSSPENVTWNVVGTNSSPISTPNVDIYMSADGGNTWQYHIGTFPNTGAATITFPNPDTDLHAARLKVKGSGNVFFNVNAENFTVTHSLVSDTDIIIYPVPVHSILRIFGGNKGTLQTVIYNAIGQLVWKGEIDGETDLPVSLWAPGVYIVKIIDIKNHHTIRKIVVE